LPDSEIPTRHFIQGKEIDFYPEGHSYQIGNRKVMGVTGMSKMMGDGMDGLMYWAAACAGEETLEILKGVMKGDIKLTELNVADLAEQARKKHMKVSGEAISIGNLTHKWLEEHVKHRIWNGS